MGISIQDLIDDGVALEARCRQCGRVVIWRGAKLLAPFGPSNSVSRVAARMVCSRDGMLADVSLRFDRTEVAREAKRRGLSLHD